MFRCFTGSRVCWDYDSGVKELEHGEWVGWDAGFVPVYPEVEGEWEWGLPVPECWGGSDNVVGCVTCGVQVIRVDM